MNIKNFYLGRCKVDFLKKTYVDDFAVKELCLLFAVRCWDIKVDRIGIWVFCGGGRSGTDPWQKLNK